MALYRGQEYKMREIAEVFNLNYNTLTTKATNAPRTPLGVDMTEIVDTLIYRRQQRDRQNLEVQELCYRLWGVKPWGKVETYSYLQDQFNMDMGLVKILKDIKDLVMFIHYAQLNNVTWMYESRVSYQFVYEGITYNKTKEFYSNYRVLRGDLVNKFVEYQGDLSKALLHTGGNPTYNMTTRVRINGVAYNSVKEASDILDFDNVIFKDKLREGYTNDEAYMYARERRRADMELLFPQTINGTVYRTYNDFIESIGKDSAYVTRNLKEGLSFAEIYNNSTKEEQAITIQGHTYTSVRAIRSAYSTTHSAVVNCKYGKGGILGFKEYIEDTTVVFNAEQLSRTSDFMNYFDLNKPLFSVIRLNLLRYKTNEERIRYLKEEEKYHKNLKELYGEELANNPATIAKEYNIVASTLKKVVSKTTTREEVEEYIKQLKERQSNTERCRAKVYKQFPEYKGKTIKEISLAMGVPAHRVIKIMENTTTRGETLEEIQKYKAKIARK